MDENKKTLLDKRIDQFCESSAELLTGIHTRHSNIKGTLKQKRKKDLEEIIAIPDVDIDFHEEDPLADLPE